MKVPRTVTAGLIALTICLGAALVLPWCCVGVAHLTGLREPAPNVAYVLLDGKREELQALRGRVVLVNFWATSCATCVKEMPAIAATYEKYKSRGYETLAVAMSYDPPPGTAAFASRQT